MVDQEAAEGAKKSEMGEEKKNLIAAAHTGVPTRAEVPLRDRLGELGLSVAYDISSTFLHTQDPRSILLPLHKF